MKIPGLINSELIPRDCPEWMWNTVELLGKVRYRLWALRVGMDSLDAMWLQWVFNAADVETGEVREQHCRKWRISQYMTAAEIVQTAFAAALAAEEHECRENFKYLGAPIFSPHLSLPALLQRAFHTETRETQRATEGHS